MRYNIDSFKWHGKAYKADRAEKIDLLVSVVKDESLFGSEGRAKL